MKKILLSFVFMFFLIESSVGQTESYDIVNQEDSTGLRQGIWVIDMEHFDLLNLDSCIVKCNFVDDTLDGLFLVYDRSEQIRFQINVYKGKREGTGIAYAANSQITGFYQYWDDKIGTLTRMSKKGKVDEIINYKDNLKHGVQLTFYSTGNVWIERLWNMGIIVKETYYYKSGRTERVIKYDQNGRQSSIEFR